MRTLALTMICLLSATALQTEQRDPQEIGRERERRYRSLEFGKSLVRPARREEFVDLEFSRLDTDIKVDVENTVGWVLQRTAMPHGTVWPIEAKEGLLVRVYAAPDKSADDLVEYRWPFEGRMLRFISSRNGIRFLFDLDQIDACQGLGRGPECASEVRKWVESVFKMDAEYDLSDRHVKYKVELPWPGELREGISFSSAPEQNLMALTGISEWYQRVDAFVEDGALVILVYRKIGQLMGYQDGSKWFAEEFRQKIRERMNERDRR